MGETRNFWGDTITPTTEEAREPRRRPKLRLPGLTGRKKRAAVGIVALTLLLAFAVVAGAAPGAIQRPFGYNATPSMGDPDVIPLPFDVAYYASYYPTGAPVFMFDAGVAQFVSPVPPPPVGTTPMAAWGADAIAPFYGNIALALGKSHGVAPADNGRQALHMNWEASMHLDGQFEDYQLVLVDRADLAPGDFDMVLNYDGLPSTMGPGEPAIEQAGWTDFTGAFMNEFPGSAFSATPLNGGLHDMAPFSLSASGTPSTEATVAVPGRFYFIFRGGMPSIDLVAPSDPTTLGSDQLSGEWESNPSVTVTWPLDATDGGGSGIDGYSVDFTQNGTGTPAPVKNREENNGGYTDSLPDGVWWFNLRTVDAAGNWSNTMHLGPFLIDDNQPVDPMLGSASPTGTPIYANSVEVTWTGAFDAGSGVDGFGVSWSEGASGVPPATKTHEETDTPSSTLTTTTAGSYWFNLRTVDNMGFWTNTVHMGPFMLSPDATPPIDPLTMGSPTHVVGQWTSNPSITITWSDDATDTPGSGVDGFSFSWSRDALEVPDDVKDMEENVLTTSTTLPDGNWWANLRTVDNAGNWTSTLHLGPFGIDTQAPSTSDDATDTYVHSATVSLTATDHGGIGVDYTRYNLDGSGWVTGTVVTTSTLGLHSLDYYSVDLTGNVEPSNNVTFTIIADTIPPVTTDNVMSPYIGPAFINLFATDVGSGVASTNWQLDGGGWNVGTNVNTSIVGTHTLEYYSIDNTGNVEATNTVGFEVYPDPYCVDDVYDVDEDGMLVVPNPGVTMNDFYTAPLLVSFPLTQTAHGQLLSTGVWGGFIYQPDPDFNGVDTFVYGGIDLFGGGSDFATVTINVQPVPDDPIMGGGASDEVTTTEDTPVNVFFDASDPDSGTVLTWSLATVPLDGTAEVSGVGTTTVGTYTPDPDFNGDDSFTVKVEDESGNTALIVVTVHVLPVNDPPVAVDDFYTVAEDTTLTVTFPYMAPPFLASGPPLLANDFDIEGDFISWWPGYWDLTGVIGSVNPIGPPGDFEYVPPADWSGTTTWTYWMTEVSTVPSLTSNTATVTITVLPVNDPPTDIQLSSNTVTENLPPATVIGTLTATDIDSAPPFTYSLEGTSASLFQVAGDQLQTAMPLDYEMQSSYDLTVTVDDGDGGTYSEPFTISVFDVNEPPVLMDDVYTVTEDTTLTVDAPFTAPPWAASGPSLIANDYDPEGDPILNWGNTLPANGTFNWLSSGEFEYRPAPNWFGTDTFTYQMWDLNAISNWATVTITVTPVNDPPVPVDDAYTVAEDSVLMAVPGVLSNDTDPVEGDPLSAWIGSQPDHGTVIFNSPTGTFVYSPNSDYFGPDSFTYWCDDGTDSVEATVNITVMPVNDAPEIAQGSTMATTTPEDTQKLIPLDASDADTDTLTWYLASNPVHGAAEASGTGASLVATYMPELDYNGIDTFEVVVVDGNGGSDTILITIEVTPVNDPPVAVDDAYTVAEDETLTVVAPGVKTNDYDVDGDPIDAWNWAGGGPYNGTRVVSSISGSFTYRPDPDWNGTDYIGYMVRDDSLATSNWATITINVTPVNDPPHDIMLSSTECSENLPPGSIVGTLSASDIDSSMFTYSLEPTTGPFEIGSGGIGLRTTVPLNYEMQPSYDITITVFDDMGASYDETFTIDVLDVNDVPVSVDDMYYTAEDTPLVVVPPGLMLNDSDEDSDTLSVVLGAGPYNGSLDASLTSGGITYTPDPNWFGIDTFEYQVWDGMALSATSTVSIEVTSVNDVPVATNDNYSTPEDTKLVVGGPGVLGNDFDVEGPMMAVLDTDAIYGALTLKPNGSFTYMPADGWSGTDVFEYHATDGEDDSATRRVRIKVKSVDTVGISVFGPDRMATAIAASKRMYPGGADYVVICTAYNWPDALGGSALAGVVDGPILVTPTGDLTPEVAAEINRLNPSKAIVLGGTLAISPATFNEIVGVVGAGNVSRIGGADRYETAKMVASNVVARLGGAYDGTAFAATGEAYPDALSASPMAAANGWPLYLIRPTGSVVDVRNSMTAAGVTDLVVLGSAGNVSTASQSTLGATGITTTRLSGGERHSTCVAIATYGVANGGLSWNGVTIARSDDFPDALTGGVYAAKQGSVLLMTPSSYLHEATGDALLMHRDSISRYSIMGGTAAISVGVRDDIRSVLR